MIQCPACGQGLPTEANFCAACGARLPGRTHAPWWVLALFSLGAFLMLYSAASSVASFYVDPTVGSDPSKTTAAYFVVGFSALLLAVQTVAIVGLARKRAWGRIAATVACAGWVLTCIGIPLSVLVLRELWRIQPAPLRTPR